MEVHQQVDRQLEIQNLGDIAFRKPAGKACVHVSLGDDAVSVRGQVMVSKY